MKKTLALLLALCLILAAAGCGAQSSSGSSCAARPPCVFSAGNRCLSACTASPSLSALPLSLASAYETTRLLPAEEKRRRRLFEGDGRPDDPGRHPAVSDTMSAARKDRSSTAATPSPIRILKDGQPVPEVDQILDIIKDNNMVLCSGHISPEETLALFKRAQEKGLRKLIATHVEWPQTGASFDMQKKYVSCGAYLEHCVINIMGGALSVKELTGQIHEIGAEHMILSTDLGQASNPDPVRALEEYASELLDAGVTKEDLRTMIVTNPAKLLAR